MRSSNTVKVVVFTDLDGTLLDLESYAADEAAPAVRQLKKAGVSIVFCSSKTLSEQTPYLEELGLRAPAIVENGSAVSWPGGDPPVLPANCRRTYTTGGFHHLVLGTQYGQVRKAIEDNASIFPYPLKYYGNSTVEQIMEITGLDREAANRAMDRRFSETLFNVKPDDAHLAQFEEALRASRCQCIAGSRYMTITGLGSDKGRAVQALIECWKSDNEALMTFGIGDSRNDLEMLRVVDRPRLVARPDGRWADIDAPGMQKVRGVGPDGWKKVAEEVLSILGR